MKKSILVLLAICLCSFAYSQTEIDAYRLSSSDLQGTARGQAMGGAFGALGGDITGVIINPAGVGVYRSSEITGTLQGSYAKASSNWNGLKEKDSSSRFSMDNISYVLYMPTGGDVLKNVNFGFSYNKVKDFDSRIYSKGKGMDRSVTDYISALTNGLDVHWTALDATNAYNNSYPWLSVLGWQGWLIKDTDGSGGYQYEPTVLEGGETVDPTMEIREKGAIRSYDFTFGANLNHNFYLGATFSLTDIDYRMDSYYTEDYEKGGYIYLDNWMETEGSGYQLKVGAIWRPVDALRLGVSYHSPTWYNMTDYYRAWSEAHLWEEGPTKAATPDNARTRYEFNTPYSWTFSLAGVIGTQAIISLDYEIKDYSGMTLKDDNGRANAYAYENGFIEDDYKMASTLRVGGEYKFTPQFSGRLGFAYSQSPYETRIKDNEIGAYMDWSTAPHYMIEGDVFHYTAGIGYRFTPQFYVDLAFVQRSQSNDLYYFPSLFDSETGEQILNSQPASLKKSSQKGLLTIGYKF